MIQVCHNRHGMCLMGVGSCIWDCFELAMPSVNSVTTMGGPLLAGIAEELRVLAPPVCAPIGGSRCCVLVELSMLEAERLGFL